MCIKYIRFSISDLSTVKSLGSVQVINTKGEITSDMKYSPTLSNKECNLYQFISVVPTKECKDFNFFFCKISGTK